MNKIITLWMLVAISATAQSYNQSTNLFFTNSIEASITLTYTGTNCLDVSRYKTFAILATGAGTNTSTNTITYTFKGGNSTTSYEVLPSFTLSGTAHGTNPFVLWSNYTVGDAIGYIKPYQIVSSVTNQITNAWTYGVLKIYPRN